MRLPSGSSIGWLRRWRLPAALAALGAIVGLLIASTAPPSYESEAGVVVAKDRIASDPIEMRRLAELAGGSRVAEEAATLLGGDAPGADLLSRVSVEPASGGGALRVVASADSRDYAPAVAAAYSTAIVDVLGGPLREGSAAAPAVEVGGASPVLWALAGLLVGAGLGVAVSLALATGAISIEPAVLRRREPPGEEPERHTTGSAEVFPGPAEIIDFDGAGAVRLSLPAKGVLTDLAERIEADGDDRRSLAVIPAEEEDSSGAAAAAIAVAAAGRGLHVLIVDARLRSPAVAELLRVEPAPGLAEYLGGAAGPRKVLRRVPAVDQDRRPSQLACLPAGGTSPESGLRGDRFRELLGRVVSVYDLVVVAGPSVSGEPDEARALAAATDAAIVICAVDDELRASAEVAAAALGESRGATLHGVVGMERS